MADFTGFYLGGVHSSTYGILRVSDGKHYSEKLIPEFEDFELELIGGDGSLYGGRKFKKTPFEIKIAFDRMTEYQFRQMRQWLGKKELQSFRFDERPYKAYWVKLESAPELEYVCFMEETEDGFIGDKERIYKGEGSLKFVAYNPYGYCIDESTQMTKNGLEEADGINWQVLDSYSPFEIIDNNVNEWGVVSGLKNSSQLRDYNVFEKTETSTKSFLLGDIDGDGEVSDDDLVKAVEIYKNPGNYSSDKLILIDFNQNGVIDLEDGSYLGIEDEGGWITPELPEDPVTVETSSTFEAKLYNPGDFDVDFQLFIDLSDTNKFFEQEDAKITLSFLRENREEAEGFIFSLQGLHKNSKILLNTKNHSLTIFYNDNKSLRYDLVKSTHWPKIPIGECILKLKSTRGLGDKIPQIKYSYQYY